MYQVMLQEVGNNIIPSLKEVAKVLPQATKVYEGFAMQNIVGKFLATIFTNSGTFQVELPELEGYRVMDAKYLNQVLIVVANKDGKYDRLVYRMSHDFDKYDLRVVSNITPLGLNFTVGDHGVCVLVDEEERVEAFDKSRHGSQVKIFDPDSAIDSGAKLYHDGATILFARKNELYQVRMK